MLDEFRTVNWLVIDKQLKHSEIMQMFQFVKKETRRELKRWASCS